MNYYKEKYGEDFVVNREKKAAPAEKKSIIKRIKALITGKK